MAINRLLLSDTSVLCARKLPSFPARRAAYAACAAIFASTTSSSCSISTSTSISSAFSAVVSAASKPSGVLRAVHQHVLRLPKQLSSNGHV